MDTKKKKPWSAFCAQAILDMGFCSTKTENLKVTFIQGYLQMLFEAWQQTSLTGCAPAALVAAWLLLCSDGEITTLYWHACGEARHAYDIWGGRKKKKSKIYLSLYPWWRCGLRTFGVLGLLADHCKLIHKMLPICQTHSYFTLSCEGQQNERRVLVHISATGAWKPCSQAVAKQDVTPRFYSMACCSVVTSCFWFSSPILLKHWNLIVCLNYIDTVTQREGWRVETGWGCSLMFFFWHVARPHRMVCLSHVGACWHAIIDGCTGSRTAHDL